MRFFSQYHSFKKHGFLVGSIMILSIMLISCSSSDDDKDNNNSVKNPFDVNSYQLVAEEGTSLSGVWLAVGEENRRSQYWSDETIGAEFESTGLVRRVFVIADSDVTDRPFVTDCSSVSPLNIEGTSGSFVASQTLYTLQIDTNREMSASMSLTNTSSSISEILIGSAGDNLGRLSLIKVSQLPNDFMDEEGAIRVSPNVGRISVSVSGAEEVSAGDTSEGYGISNQAFSCFVEMQADYTITENDTVVDTGKWHLFHAAILPLGGALLDYLDGETEIVQGLSFPLFGYGDQEEGSFAGISAYYHETNNVLPNIDSAGIDIFQLSSAMSVFPVEINSIRAEGEKLYANELISHQSADVSNVSGSIENDKGGLWSYEVQFSFSGE